MQEEYRSIHEGRTIDEAVGRAKPGADIDQRINEMRMNFIRRLNAETEIAVQAVRDAAQNALRYLNGTFTITDDPDYLAAWTDTEGRLLLGIRKDGTVYYGAGIPPQIAQELRNLSGWEDRVSNLETNFASHDRAIDSLIYAHSDLVNAAFTELREGADGLWYAYNMRGLVAGGPYRFGSGGVILGGVTLAEHLNAGSDDTVTYQSPTPITGAEIAPSVTISGIFNAVSDDSVTYLEPTPIVIANA